MKFAVILREAGVCSRIFPNCAEIPVVLYDGKDRISTEEDVKFATPLFEENSESFNDFFNFVDRLDANPDYTSINVKIDVGHVIIHYRTPEAKVFLRKDPINPCDCTD